MNIKLHIDLTLKLLESFFLLLRDVVDSCLRLDAALEITCNHCNTLLFLAKAGHLVIRLVMKQKRTGQKCVQI